ncbi:MAG: type VI secretion system tip protein TssI/VgrG, partial [Pseudomonadota bacterium]|nr:type VI secretion system tip protein TssI/VgrG [Pseudomonadota bacterium]
MPKKIFGLPFGADKLLFKSLQGEEQLSKPFHFNLELLSQVDDLKFSQIIGQNLGITIQFPEDNQRYIHGMVSRFIQAGSDARFTIYHAELRPWLWALTLTENCRSVAEIIKKIFNELGFSDYRFKLMYPHEPREYCVQYQETAFNFISRLMEDEGMFYFFEHQADKHTLIIADDLGVHPACSGIDTARFCHSPNDTTPEYAKRDQGDTKVRRRIEAHELEHQLLEGQSHCFSFTAGHQFKLTEHIRAEFNRSYVLRWVAHTLSLTHYSNAFKALPVELPFRPPLTTPKPKIVSTQTAIVTGPSGEEIYTDQYGRIKVQFHWDQEGQYDENSSCWIRVNQGLAGKTWGNLFIPRIGQEVIISFLNGNPDTPIVTGAVYNGRQPVPYPLPAEQTKSTLKTNSSKGGAPFANYNELRFEDKMGQEEIYLQGEKDWNILIKND